MPAGDFPAPADLEIHFNWSTSKRIEILLVRDPDRIHALIFHAVVPLLRPDVEDHADGQEVKVPDGNPGLKASQEEQRCRHFPATAFQFFLDSTSVMRLVPQSSKISGSTS